MAKKMRGFTRDGWVRVQRTVLRRVVADRLQALLRGDFYVRNHLGEEDYDPIVREVEALDVATPPRSSAIIRKNAEEGANGGAAANASCARNGSCSSTAAPQQPQSASAEPPPHKFTAELEAFTQLVAASIMIDASMRGECSGESDTRFIKKKKRLLARTLQGPKLGAFRGEVLRFDRMRRGEVVEDEEELVESEESKDSSSDERSESESEEFAAAKKKGSSSSAASRQKHFSSKWSSHTHLPPRREPSGESSSDEEEEEEERSTASDTATSNTSTGAEDGFSTSATSSKHTKKREKKRLKKERKKEKKRIKKERRRREKEERKRRKKKLEKEKHKTGGKKRRKARYSEEGDAADFKDNEFSDGECVAAGRSSYDPGTDRQDIGSSYTVGGEGDDGPLIYEVSTREGFERYQHDLLSRVPGPVRERFREGAFSRWGKDWLPVLELGPFDVEPGPVRDMWLEMFDNTQENGRDMTRLIFWYGVKYEDRGQAYSFVPETKLITYEEGHRKGYCRVPKKIQKKIEKKQKLTKTEEQIKRGLIEIEADMERGKSERAAWMMQFKEDYELAEEAHQEEADQKLRSASVGEERGELRSEEAVSCPKKRKPGRPKKEENSMDKQIKRKPGRPKKLVDERPLEEDDEEVKIPQKRKRGRPKKSETQKVDRAAEQVVARAKKRESPAKKWVTVDEDQGTEIETEDDDNDRDYHDDGNSGDDGDMDVHIDDDSDTGRSKKHKASTSDKRPKKKAKLFMTDEEKVIERRAKAAEYREKKAREKAEAQGLEYVKGRVGRKSKQTVLEEEQQKFTKCEEVFLPMMEGLAEAKDTSNMKSALRCINSIMERVELLTPPFLREYPLGMLVKMVRKSFEGVHPEVKDQCKRLTNEMKRVYSEKEKKIPDEFEPVKNKKSTPKVEQETEAQVDSEQEPVASSVTDSAKSEKLQVKSENNMDNASIKTEKSTVKPEKLESTIEQSIPRTNSAITLSEPMSRKMVGAISPECLPDAVKLELPPKQKKMFSLKGMFEKPKTFPKQKSSAPIPSTVISVQLSPKPKLLPSWVIGPAMKREDFHEQHAKERAFGLEFLVDAASLVSPAKKFDPISVSQSFELAIFAETKLRGQDWHHYWEKVHDVVAMLTPGKNKRNAILQGIILGNYQEPSELVKLSRREIQSLNQLKN